MLHVHRFIDHLHKQLSQLWPALIVLTVFIWFFCQIKWVSLMYIVRTLDFKKDVQDTKILFNPVILSKFFLSGHIMLDLKALSFQHSGKEELCNKTVSYH